MIGSRSVAEKFLTSVQLFIIAKYNIVVKGFIKLIIVIAVLGGIWFAWEQWKGNEAIQVDYQTEPLEKET